MAGRPRKTLAELVEDGTFESRREHHRALLGGERVPWPALAELQVRYRQEHEEFIRRAIAREFKRRAQLVA